MPAYLRVQAGKTPVERFDLPSDRPVIIGRGEGCDLRIEDRSLSRLHFSIEREPDGWHIVDCKSTNGTRVGGFKVSDAILAAGEEIQIGDVRIEFQVENEGVPSPCAAPDPPGSPLAGRHFGQFELLRLIHAGHSVSVYRARDSQRVREVALTILNPNLTSNELQVERFKRGALAAAKLNHPGIVQLYSIGQHEGRYFLAMELVDGPSLREILSQVKTLPPVEAVSIARRVAQALDAAAQKGVVHRNVQPSSILIAGDGTLKISDFDLARRVDQADAEQITQTGEIVGDAEYLAPECFRDSHEIDCRADVYSLGVCLYQMLTGQPPFREPNVTRLMTRVLDEQPAPIRSINSAVPERLESVVLKCLAKDRDERFQTPQQLADALDALGDLAAPTVEPATPKPTETDDQADLEVAPVGDEPTSLPDTVTHSTGSWRRFVIIPKPSSAPAERPWSTLIATIVIVVGVGSLFIFGGRAWLQGPRPDLGEVASSGDETDGTSEPANAAESSVSGSTEPGRSVNQPGGTKTKTTTGVSNRTPAAGPRPKSKQLVAALADPERLVVEPGTPLRSISDALDVAKDRQVIEVASNDSFRSEIKVPARSITLVANPEFHPILHNTVRINGGGTIRIEGFHFEPYAADKPAIQVDRMPEKLELASCSFRAADGVLIAIGSAAGSSSSRPQLSLERSFAVGNIIFGLTDSPPDLRLVHSCLVADQAAINWQLSPGGTNDNTQFGVLLRNNTIVARSVFHVELGDQGKPLGRLPKTSIRIDDNTFAFPTQYPCTFFRWESFRRPDITMDRFAWSGANNAFSGLGKWSMATTLALSDAAATPQVAVETPDDWQNEWATEVAGVLKLPPEFSYMGPPKAIADIRATDYEPGAKSKLRESGTDGKPLGADIRLIPSPPAGKPAR